jgi:small-conductance mechanosensitive channel
MFGWIEISLLATAFVLLVIRVLPFFGSYRPLFGGAGVLMLITAALPRAGNPIGDFVFGRLGGGPHLPGEVVGIAGWLVGAWLCKSLLDLVLSKTLFPENDEPHARRLFADLASGLIYVLAVVGIVGTVFNEPISTFLATSGVLAIVLGLALQNTLGDVIAGLAINIERPFAAGDWITLTGQVSGQVMQVNWRATRLRTWSHDMAIIPNSVAAKAMVTNHSHPKGPHRCVLHLKVDLAVPPTRVIEVLGAAAKSSTHLAHGTTPRAFARSFSDSQVEYELAFALESFGKPLGATSDIIVRIADAFRGLGIAIGAPAMDVRIIHPADQPVGPMATPVVAAVVPSNVAPVADHMAEVSPIATPPGKADAR